MFFKNFPCPLGTVMSRIQRQRLCPLESWVPSKYKPGCLGFVKCGKFFLTSTFLLLRTTFSSLAVIPFKGGPLEKRRHFPSFYYYYFFKSGISCRYSFLLSPGSRVSDFSLETLLWKLFEPLENQLRGFFTFRPMGILCVMDRNIWVLQLSSWVYITRLFPCLGTQPELTLLLLDVNTMNFVWTRNHV